MCSMRASWRPLSRGEWPQRVRACKRACVQQGRVPIADPLVAAWAAYFAVVEARAEPGTLSAVESGAHVPGNSTPMQFDTQHTTIRESSDSERQQAQTRVLVQTALPDPPPVVLLSAACAAPATLERLLGCWTPCVQAQGLRVLAGAGAGGVKAPPNGNPRVAREGGAMRPLPVSGSVLLHGGEGVGKFSLVARAAASLGLHVCAVEGAELALRPPREAEQHLREHAERAVAAVPAVLVLRHIDDFAAEQGAEQDSDARGAVSRCSLGSGPHVVPDRTAHHTGGAPGAGLGDGRRSEARQSEWGVPVSSLVVTSTTPRTFSFAHMASRRGGGGVGARLFASHCC